MNTPTHEEALAALLSAPTVSADAAALVLGVSRASIYSAARRGDFQTVKVGRRVVIASAPIRAQLGLNTTDAN